MAADDIQQATPQILTPAEHQRPFFSARSSVDGDDDSKIEESKPSKWGMGILNDPKTHEVPGTP